jgi:hypothetical protein
MKITSQKTGSELLSRSAQLSSSSTPAQPEKKDNRLPIDTEQRKKNRTLPTAKVLELLKTSNPGLFNLAEVVGKWVATALFPGFVPFKRGVNQFSVGPGIRPAEPFHCSWQLNEFPRRRLCLSF